MAVFVNYNDREWVAKFITEVLSEEDFIDIIETIEFDGILSKLGYREVLPGKFVFTNENNDVEEDIGLEKFRSNIERNELFKDRMNTVTTNWFQRLGVYMRNYYI